MVFYVVEANQVINVVNNGVISALCLLDVRLGIFFLLVSRDALESLESNVHQILKGEIITYIIHLADTVVWRLSV